MDKLNNSEDVKAFLRGQGFSIGEETVRQVVNVLTGKVQHSLYSLYTIRSDKPIPVCGKGTVDKIKKLYVAGKLAPYLVYLSQSPIGSGEYVGPKQLAEAEKHEVQNSKPEEKGPGLTQRPMLEESNKSGNPESPPFPQVEALRSFLEQYAKQIDPVFQKAREAHLNEIRSLIDDWWPEINAPEIFQVGLDFSGFILSENSPLYEGVKEHLPLPSFWQDYSNWKINRLKYIDTCKELRKQIRESWTIKETEIALSFEAPILRWLSGQDKTLQYELYIVQGHQATDLEYQLLQVNDCFTVEGRETKTRQFHRIKHEECCGETLPITYQKIADTFLGSEIAKQAKQLLRQSRELESKILSPLQQELTRREYNNYTCKLCPGQAQRRVA
jgi:hypothetical protein